MEFSVLVFSNLTLNGQIKFNLSDLFVAFAKTNHYLKEIQIENFDKEKCRTSIEKKQNLIVFCENNVLDNVIIDNIRTLGAERKMIDELAVIFEKEGKKKIFLPIDLDWQSLLSKALEEKDEGLKKCKFHAFGISQKEVISALEKIKSENESLSFHVLGDNLLTDAYVVYKGQENLIDDMQVKIASVFRDKLYSENELELSQIVFQLLRLKNVKIAIREGVTGGKIVSKLFAENDNFSQVLASGEVVEEIELSPEKIYEESYNLLRKANCEVVMVVRGEWKDNGLNTLFAIGDKNSIFVYKNRYNANKKTALDMVINCALFHLVKKLRQNDFAF